MIDRRQREKERQRERDRYSTLIIASDHPKAEDSYSAQEFGWVLSSKQWSYRGRGAHLSHQHLGSRESEASLLHPASPIPKEMTKQQQHTTVGSAGRHRRFRGHSRPG